MKTNSYSQSQLKFLLTLIAIILVPEFVSSQIKYTEIIDSLPVRNTHYKIRIPENWNGMLISDLDYYKAADSKKYLYLLEKGYAFSGTKRRNDRSKHYDPAREIHDIVSILDIFESKFGKPKRTIQYGCSGGGNVTLGMAEIHPDRIDGAIAVGAPTSLWMSNTHLDGFFVLKALIAPNLPIVNIPTKDPKKSEIKKAWKKALEDAQKTPEGRARIALAVTIGQWPAWGGGGKAPFSEPDYNDIEALQNSMYHCVSRKLPRGGTGGHTMLEQAAGLLKGNTGVDYSEFYNNGDPLYKKAVTKLYKDAQINIKDDLKKINAFPRIAADPSAIKWWSAPGRTHIGEPKVPLFRMHNNGDGLVLPGMTQGYEDLVKQKGYSDFFRSAYVNRWGHCTYSIAEFLVAIEVINKRIDTGLWHDTTPEALNELAKSLDSNGSSNFYHYRKVKKYNRVWVPSTADYQGEIKN